MHQCWIMLTNLTNDTHNNQTSSYENQSHTDTGLTLTDDILIGTTLAVIICISIAGNILVCVAVLTDRQLKKTSNYFIVSLAIADLLVALLVMSFAVVNDIMERWVFGQVFCSVWISLDIMCSTASILNLCVISLDRYVHIKDPLRYESWMTSRKAFALIASVWLLSVLISFLPIHLGWHEYPSVSRLEDEYVCMLEINAIYAVVSSTVSFYIPCIVMLSIYCQLYNYAKKHVESIKRTYTSERLHSSGSPGKGGSYKVSDHKAAVTLGIIMGVFLFCWCPFFLVNLIAAFCTKCIPDVLFKILTWLGYVNSALNPIIYSIFNTEFREAFRKILFPKSCSCTLLSNGGSSLNSGKAHTKRSYDSGSFENGLRKESTSRLVTEKITSL